MTTYQATRVYFKDERHGFFIMNKKSNVSGDLIRIINQNGTEQLSIEIGVRLKEVDPGFYQTQIGHVKETDIQAVVELARNNPPTPPQTFREWTDAFIEMLTKEGLLSSWAPGTNFPASWGRA
ncbi:unnamed protein product [Clonostachys solani]|uniref:Uncharacterized protein n=1 Tax=Clonostachys solani TaxID=160281 RepID=A0A9N9YY59_9HYPO|nr:unnamed protein product [Clonostachys solani]